MTAPRWRIRRTPEGWRLWHRTPAGSLRRMFRDWDPIGRPQPSHAAAIALLDADAYRREFLASLGPINIRPDALPLFPGGLAATTPRGLETAARQYRSTRRD